MYSMVIMLYTMQELYIPGIQLMPLLWLVNDMPGRYVSMSMCIMVGGSLPGVSSICIVSASKVGGDASLVSPVFSGFAATVGNIDEVESHSGSHGPAVRIVGFVTGKVKLVSFRALPPALCL